MGAGETRTEVTPELYAASTWTWNLVVDQRLHTRQVHCGGSDHRDARKDRTSELERDAVQGRADVLVGASADGRGRNQNRGDARVVCRKQLDLERGAGHLLGLVVHQVLGGSLEHVAREDPRGR